MNPAAHDDSQTPQANHEAPLGVRLRRAREAAGLTVAQVAEKLRLKSATVEALEKEAFDALGAPVYVRGYYNSYARLVGVPTVLVDGIFAKHQAPAPELHTTARVSHSRYLIDRYAKRAVYVVLTASIVVPVILLATRDQLPRQGATLTSLDAPIGIGGPTAVPVATEVADIAVPDRIARSAGESPVMASLGPFYSPALTQAPAVPAAPLAAAAATSGADGGLTLELRGDSWVEVLDRQGHRLEQGLLRAGETRRFAPGTVGKVSLGNAAAVEVRMNGEITDIAAFRRANVARFTVSSEGSLTPVGG